jgi:hypothetical protein
VTLLVLWLVPFTPAALAGTVLAVTAVGIWAGSRVERLTGLKDPG